jgi:four helix bundle protein
MKGEGSGGTKPEFKKFLKISRRSVREGVVATTISKRRDYITVNEEKESREKCIELSKMLSGLINSL